MALAVLSAAEPQSPALLDRLAHEYELRDELEAAWAAKPLALVREGGRTALLLDDPGGEPLERLIGAPMETESFLRLAIGLVAALGRAHQRGLVHKDVKPANILVNCGDGLTRLTGFGIASRLPRERQAPQPPEVIAGTLAYMAPEQTGRMNRSIDSRSDLYALGVTFYQMLTGDLPFSAADPMEWVYCHIARRPIAPADRLDSVPDAISRMVMKLLAKTAEERYQTAAGVEHDLRRSLAELKLKGRIEPFALGERDTPDRLLIPEKLYGREREFLTLLAAFDRVVETGAPELVLVSGYSGIGKSSVVNELHKALVPPRGVFAAGKFDQYKRDIPYSTLAQAFQSLVRSLLSKSDTELANWREALLGALGANGRLMVDLIPELSLIIGDQPPVPALSPRDAQRRFRLVFRRFLAVFASAEHPLALFLDDLQWLDAATLDLLEDLLTQADVRHLLLIGAYRDNEVGSAHPLRQTLDAIRKSGAGVEEILLAPLELGDVNQLVVDALTCEPERGRRLAQLVHEKTGGNPFFAVQFFTALAEEGLLAFDPDALAWRWDIDRIRAKSYTDNVVDLMVGKLKRLSVPAQEAMKQLACLGNVADIATLAMVHGETEQALHAALWDAVHAGLVYREGGGYKFLHDRIQQAAYSLIPEARRAEVHLRVGRALLASMSADQLAEHLFDVANQFSRGGEPLTDRQEKAQVATIHRRAGRKAKASSAYTSASVYFSTGAALLDESDWGSQYELTFSLRLECAECAFLTGDFDTAEHLIEELLLRAASKVDQASAYHLKVLLHTVKSENTQAVASGLTCLSLFGIDIPAHPTWEQLQAECETVLQSLNGRSIESLIDLPLMDDSELQAAMQVLSTLLAPAYFTDFHLRCFLACRMVTISNEHGTCGASAHGIAFLGSILGPAFHRYGDGYRFAKLGCDLTEKHGFLAYQAKANYAMGVVASFTAPVVSAIDFMRAAFRAATETGDLTYACYCMERSVTGPLLRNDPLAEVWRESERALDFVRKAGFRDIADIIVTQQRFIATMQGRTATFSTFSDAQFDEASFEAQLTGDRMTLMICWYWIFKLKARFLSGDYAAALAAADKAKPLLWASRIHIQLLDYFYYAALTVAALFEKASAEDQARWRDLLTAHREQLREWADENPSTFSDKHALVVAEIARLEGRDLDAMRSYEEAIRAARQNGFVQNEGLAHEVAARFYTARGFETIANAYLRNARNCYSRWGADGKVRQLDEMHPLLTGEEPSVGPKSTMAAPVEQLDLATVIKLSQAVSGEIVLEKLIDTLMRTAIEQAGGERAVLVLARGAAHRIAAEARILDDTVLVDLRDEAVTEAALPESVLHLVLRTKETIILDDAAALSEFAEDRYIRERQPRSVLCLPLMNPAKLIGLLYLENNLAPRVFAPARTAVLKLLASQAAIALENTHLYRDLAQREAKIRRLVDANIIGVFTWDSEGRIVEANDAFLRIVGYERQDIASRLLTWRALTPGEWLESGERQWAPKLMAAGSLQPCEREYFRKDGSRVPVLLGVATFSEAGSEGVAFVLDLTERKRSEAEARDSERRYRETQMQLAHANRVATMGQLTASIAHEVNQPIGATIINAQSGLRWLSAEPSNLDEARQAFSRIMRDGERAGAVVGRIRDLVKKATPRDERVEIDAAIREVIELLRSEATKSGVTVQTELTEGLPVVLGDRVELQQVILNLIVNAIEAVSEVGESRRNVSITTGRTRSGDVLVAVRDSGPGLASTAYDRVFEAFHTTKPNGLGLGLSICRSIVESHGGRLWASPNAPRGAVFQFTLPAHADIASRR
ncbi:MAG TPA: AAA family ATPase [Roseiarcus sp.]